MSPSDVQGTHRSLNYDSGELNVTALVLYLFEHVTVRYMNSTFPSLKDRVSIGSDLEFLRRLHLGG